MNTSTFYRVSECNENWNEKGIEYDLGTDSPWMTHGIIRNTDGEMVGLANDREVTDAFPDVFTLIESNGSKWMGQKPDTLDDLCNVMSEHRLIDHFEPGFEPIDHHQWYRQRGMIRFHGNFEALSHVFSIDTNDPETIKTLKDHLELCQ